jgi:phospholipase C
MPCGGYLLPFRLQSGKVNALGMNSLPHGWATDGLPMWNHGAWDRWTQFKTELTMGHFTAQDVPWHWALVNNWTLADHNHCSFNGSTDPNRFYIWSGTIDPHGVAGGPELSNPISGNPAWTSIYDVMQDAGVDWRAMGAAGGGNDMGARTFQRIHAAAQSSDPAVRDQAVRGKLVDAAPINLRPNQMDPANIDIILADFI